MKYITTKYKILFLFLFFLISISFSVFARELYPHIQKNTSYPLFTESEDFGSFYQKTRIKIVKQLISQWYDKFITTPYLPWTFSLHLSWSTDYPEYPDFIVQQNISRFDSLDLVLRNHFSQYKKEISHYFIYGKSFDYRLLDIQLNTWEIHQLKNVYLFKSLKDLKDLWYLVSSYRLRTNTDATYRRNNIYNSYYNIWNVRILNPGEEFSFMDEIHYDKKNPKDNIPLSSGLGQAGGVKSMYGWGICGWGFGIFGVLAVNQWINILERHNHTTRYRGLYNNQLNGKNVWFPWLDTSVYSFPHSKKDFRVKNIRNYPIVLVMNYDASYWWNEEIFSLWKESDRWSFEYLGKQWSCYVWDFNGEKFRSCYKNLK